MGNCIIDTRGSNKLADNNTLGTIYHERTGSGHQRQITHEYLMLTDLIILFIMETDLDLQRRCISSVTLHTFFN